VISKEVVSRMNAAQDKFDADEEKRLNQLAEQAKATS
jgi:hypothetical protein